VLENILNSLDSYPPEIHPVLGMSCDLDPLDQTNPGLDVQVVDLRGLSIREVLSLLNFVHEVVLKMGVLHPLKDALHD